MDGIFPTIDSNACKKCGICAENCPTKILVKQEYGMVFHPGVGVDCLFCGECESSCPESAIRCSYLIRIK